MLAYSWLSQFREPLGPNQDACSHMCVNSSVIYQALNFIVHFLGLRKLSTEFSSRKHQNHGWRRLPQVLPARARWIHSNQFVWIVPRKWIEQITCLLFKKCSSQSPHQAWSRNCISTIVPLWCTYVNSHFSTVKSLPDKLDSGNASAACKQL